MSSEEAIKRIGFVVDKTINDWEKVIVEIATSANTLLQTRITTTGYNAENRLFSPYTERYRKMKEKRRGSAVTFVDFAFSGNMWASVKVISSTEEHKKGVARISTLKSDEMAKLSGNTEKKGTILDLNATEVNSLAKLLSDRLTEIWHNQGL